MIPPIGSNPTLGAGRPGSPKSSIANSLKQKVIRKARKNINRFPKNMVQISKADIENLMRCQNVTPRNLFIRNEGCRRKLPYAFTEQGIYTLMKGTKNAKRIIKRN